MTASEHRRKFKKRYDMLDKLEAANHRVVILGVCSCVIILGVCVIVSVGRSIEWFFSNGMMG
jgi:hypothetical protein